MSAFSTATIRIETIARLTFWKLGTKLGNALAGVISAVFGSQKENGEMGLFLSNHLKLLLCVSISSIWASVAVKGKKIRKAGSSTYIGLIWGFRQLHRP
jgi:hypothetical protein